MSIDLLELAADAHGPLLDEVVLVGGAFAPRPPTALTR
jgi:hypothetical protein